MKKSVFVFALCVFMVQFSFSQLKVAANGNVGVRLEPSTLTPLSTLSIGGVGSIQNKVSIINGFSTTTTTALSINQSSGASGTIYGILSTTGAGPSTAIGIKGECAALYPMYYVGKSYGVLGVAGNCQYGYNYGVYGTTNGTNYGAGIVGTTYGTLDVYVPGTYAGYFYGDVGVSGTINGVTINNSDIRYKRDIVELNTKKSLDNVLRMIPIEYNLKQIYHVEKGDSVKKEKMLYDENSQVFKKKHYGLIAQDLQKIYPDLVYQNDSGYLAVNYVELIPVLIQSIKVLNDEIETLKAKIDASSTSSKIKSSSEITETDALTYPVLEQNIPNPFNTATTIGFYLPASISTSNIYIYDMNGSQLKNFPITERGKSSVTIQGSEFNAGMYLYALIADSKVIDTKRMILTK